MEAFIRDEFWTLCNSAALSINSRLLLTKELRDLYK